MCSTIHYSFVTHLGEMPVYMSIATTRDYRDNSRITHIVHFNNLCEDNSQGVVDAVRTICETVDNAWVIVGNVTLSRLPPRIAIPSFMYLHLSTKSAPITIIPQVICDAFKLTCPGLGPSKEGFQCAICYEEESCSAIHLPCNHAFHPNCIGYWLEKVDPIQFTRLTCPMCRNESMFGYSGYIPPTTASEPESQCL